MPGCWIFLRNSNGAGGYTIFDRMEHAFVQGKHTMYLYNV